MWTLGSSLYLSTLLTAFPFECIYVVSRAALSFMLSSSSEPSTLSNALTLATGDLGEVGRIRCPMDVELTLHDLPETKEVILLDQPYLEIN